MQSKGIHWVVWIRQRQEKEVDSRSRHWQHWVEIVRRRIGRGEISLIVLPILPYRLICLCSLLPQSVLPYFDGAFPEWVKSNLSLFVTCTEYNSYRPYSEMLTYRL